jgi:ferric-dicitrate binding protein FerR (iron transport regulator)
MNTAPIRCVIISGAMAACLAGVAMLPARAEIGSTTLVVRTVLGTLETQTKQLVVHDGVEQNELITTAPDAASQIEFVDGTKLALGPRARVILDKFVYDPDPSKGAFFLSVTEGVFRFVTGSMDHKSYAITTPNGTIGVRGTKFNLLVLGDRTICQMIDGEAFGKSGDDPPMSFRAGEYFTMRRGTSPSLGDDKSILDGLVQAMDSLLSGPRFAELSKNPETHPPLPPLIPVSPTRP